jgi:hypothetical protein
MSLVNSTLIIVAISLSGCTTPVYRVPAASSPSYAQAEEVDLVPPVPTFTTSGDCELAYGAGECGTGAEVFAKASLAPPEGAGTWFIPFTYGVMTGVLVNRYFAPPTIFVPTIQYRTYISTAVVERYRVVDRRTIEVYHRAPPSVRIEAVRAGPVRFAPTRGVITARPYEHRVEGHSAGGMGEHSTSTPLTTRLQASPTPPIAQRPATPLTPGIHRPSEAVPTPPKQVAAATPTAVAQRPAEPVHAPAPRQHEAVTPPPPVRAAPERSAKAKPCNPALPKSSTNCSA